MTHALSLDQATRSLWIWDWSWEKEMSLDQYELEYWLWRLGPNFAFDVLANQDPRLDLLTGPMDLLMRGMSKEQKKVIKQNQSQIKKQARAMVRQSANRKS
jgi:hypothetical protein